ncbi:DUF4403 family protein [uncultured Deinococcus sp.]|uniref:DUF4403 family protein n=1 Tax=uncultured Deinococcus sp. TaxID=158789 RepID=UPI003748F93B
MVPSLHVPLLLAALSTGPVSAAAPTVPAPAASRVVLPVSVPLAGVQAAAEARVPAELARLDQTRSFLGGAFQVRLSGAVTRTGTPTIVPDGDALVVRVPLRAEFQAAPVGVGAALGRTFGGAATVSLRLTPYVTPEWEAGVRASADAVWTDPLSVELAPGVKISVQSLVGGQVRAALDGVTAGIERSVREGLGLRRRAGTLWARVQRPWTLPLPEPGYALVSPQALEVTPFRLSAQEVGVTVGATFGLRAGLGRAPEVAARSLPPLASAPTLAPGLSLAVPLALPYADLSALATRSAAARPYTLPVLTGPVLRVLDVRLTPAGTRVRAAVRAEVRGPLGLRLEVTTDVTGTPVLDPATQVVTLRDVSVQTRREGLSGRAVAWLADARAQEYLSRAARFDLTPALERARSSLAARLPFSPVPGLNLDGTIGPLRVTALDVTPQALVVRAAVTGTLRAEVQAGALK